MSPARFWYLLGKGPRVFYLVRELWNIFAMTEQEQLDQFFQDTEEFVKNMKGAKSDDEKKAALARISRAIGEL